MTYTSPIYIIISAYAEHQQYKKKQIMADLSMNCYRTKIMKYSKRGLCEIWSLWSTVALPVQFGWYKIYLLHGITSNSW